MTSRRHGTTRARCSALCIPVVLAALLLPLSRAGDALAAFRPVGSPRTSGSWSQRFQEDGVGLFDRVQILAATGGPFESPTAQSGFDVAGWAQGCDNTIESSAAGPATNLMQWDITFQGSSAPPLDFFFQAFNGATLLQTSYVHWTGSAWRIDNTLPGTASWPGGVGCSLANAVVPLEPSVCLTSPTQCLTVPVDIIRSDPTPIRGYSVTFTLSAGLALCGAPRSAVTEGGYLNSPPFGTDYHVVANPDGSYTVDCAILGAPCGQTAQAGNLFNVSLKGVAEGVGVVTITGVQVRDCLNGDIWPTWGPPIPVTVDFTAPGAIADLSAARLLATGQGTGTTHRIRLTWSGAAGTVSLYRAPFGNYPEYDDDNPGMLPPNPALAPGAPWQLVSSDATSPYDDLPPGRDYWYYVAFVRDACGNLSGVSNATAGTLDYLLGDVSDGSRPGVGNNRVFTEDISLLGTYYGLAGEVAVDAVAYLDVGPTSNRYVDGRPKPDDLINFEDLIIFAINYSANVEAPQLAARPAPADQDELTLEAPSRVGAGEVFAVTLRMKGAGDIQALSAQLGWDAAVAEPLVVEVGEWVAAQDGVVMSSGPGDVDAALLGAGRGLAGDGTLATVHFHTRAGGDPRIVLAGLQARDSQNQPAALASPDLVSGAAPGTGLLPAVPNPFDRATTLAFGLGRAGPVRLDIYSVDGRRVKTLFEGNREAGAFRLQWDGADERGQRMQPGVYFARLMTASGRFQRVITLLR